MALALELRHIFKYYGTLAANQDVNIAVERGQVHAIIGENGAGKSTLMNILAGVIQPSAGEIILDGRPIVFHDANNATAAGIGMVQQEFMLFDDLSVLENIILGYEDTKGWFLDYEAGRKKVQAICDEYGFHFDLNALVRELPIVIQQQIEIVKVLFKQAKIIILDEPTAVLPPQEVEGLFRAVRFLVKQGKTIIFITHKLKEVLAISDTITVMKGGKVTGLVRTTEATETMLTGMMVGREVMLNIKKDFAVNKGEVLLRVEKLKVQDDRGISRVKNISFDLRKGEILGLVGIAGNGQNELVEALAGLRNYSEGAVEFMGKSLERKSPRENRLGGMCYVPQDRIRIGSSLTSTLVENTAMGRHLKEFRRGKVLMDHKKAASWTREVAERFNVKTQSVQLDASSLSGGNLQKLIVGREFSQHSKVLIIEDPTRGIDVGAIEFIWNEIVKQAEQEGVAVLLITYDLTEAMTLSDRLLVMYDGKIRKTIPGPDYDEKEIGLYMMGGGSND